VQQECSGDDFAADFCCIASAAPAQVMVGAFDGALEARIIIAAFLAGRSLTGQPRERPTPGQHGLKARQTLACSYKGSSGPGASRPAT
jgi:hypothetical protein